MAGHDTDDAGGHGMGAKDAGASELGTERAVSGDDPKD